MGIKMRKEKKYIVIVYRAPHHDCINIHIPSTPMTWNLKPLELTYQL